MFFNFLKEQPPTPMGNIVSSCVFDLDATLSASYIGSGTSFKNAEQSPADSEAQSEYDFGTGIGAPTFVGTHGSKEAYFSFNSDSFVGDNALSTFLDGIHKTTGGSDFGFVMTVYYVSATQIFMSNRSAGGTNIGVAMYSTTAADNLFMIQRGGTGNSADPDSGLPLTAGAWNLIAGSHEHSSGTTRFWVDSATATENTNTFNTTTASASATDFSIGAYEGGTAPLANGTRIKSVQVFNSYLTNANITSIANELTIRHGQSYI